MIHASLSENRVKEYGLNNVFNFDLNEAQLLAAKTNNTVLNHSTLYIKEDQEGYISLGEDIPYSQYNEGKRETHWKFSGLKIRIKLESRSGFIHLDQKISFSLPVQNKSEKLRYQSRMDLEIKKISPIFKMSLKSLYHDQANLPFIRHIPFLRNIVKEKNQSKFKGSILGFIHISKAKDVPDPKE